MPWTIFLSAGTIVDSTPPSAGLAFCQSPLTQSEGHGRTRPVIGPVLLVWASSRWVATARGAVGTPHRACSVFRNFLSVHQISPPYTKINAPITSTRNASAQ